MKMKSIIQFLIGVSFVAISACGGGGGGSGGDGDGGGGFPTPTLPAGARTIDADNAEETAESALIFAQALLSVAGKPEGPPSIQQVIKLVSDQVTKRNRNLGSVAAGKTTEDLSDELCFTGTAIDTYTEGENSITGNINFTDCVIGEIEDLGEIVVNGTAPYEGSFNDATQVLNIEFGGTLTLDFGTEQIIVVLDFIESENEVTGAFSLTPSFSLEGIPGGGYLVTTVEPLQGFFDDVNSGELSVAGADNTKLCMEVTLPNTVTVELDDGLGDGCMPLDPVLVIPI
jgi:hypothetical protein